MKGALYDKTAGKCIELGETLLIGRRNDCELVLNDVKISRKHAMIRYQDDGYWLFDLGSANGCYVNERRVTNAVQLRDRDLVRLGPFEYQFVSGESQRVPAAFETTDFSATIADIRTVPVMMLVSDVCGFTKLSERLRSEPEILAQVMGLWYGECRRVLGDFGATIDKFIGDSVLAYWLETSPAARANALLATRSLVEGTRRVLQGQRDVIREHDIQLEVGAGLHLGSVAHGPMSQGTFTLLGDAVNVTFRLEALTRKLGVSILVSGEFLADWDDGHSYCSAEGSHAVSGRSAPLDVFTVHSWPR